MDQAILTSPAEMTLDKVLKVYSGKPGCMCGCRGKYAYPKARQEQGGKDRGYAVADDEVSDRSVKILFNKVMKNPKVEFADDGMYAVVETETRSTVVYFK